MLGKSELIGIDVGQYSIKLARIKQSTKSITATHLTYEVIPSEIREKRDREALSKMILATLKKQKIAKGQAVLHVNMGDVIMRNILIEGKFSGQALEGAIEIELSTALPFGIDQVYYDFDEKPNDKNEYTTVAVRRDVADAKVDLLRDLPKTFSDPEVDVDAYALSRLVSYIIKKEGSMSGNMMIIDVGYNRSRFYIYKDSELIFNREQQIGGKQVNDIIVDVFDISEESAENRKISKDFTNSEYEDLVLGPYVHTFSEQLNLVTDFYQASEHGREPIEKIYLTGGGARLAGFADSLASTFPAMNIKPLDLSAYIKLNDKDSSSLQNGINHALAIGLAVEK